MRDYGKVHTSFWSSDTIRSLSEDGRTLAFYLMTSPHSTIAGVFRLPDGYVCEDMQWPAERVAKGFEELLAKGFANRCGTTKWVWVFKHLEWNPPENPNQRKSAHKIAQSVPEECGWKLDFMRVCGSLLRSQDGQQANPSATVAEPFTNQEQEQEQEQDKKKSPQAAPPDRGSRLPKDWVLPDDWQQWAQAERPDLDVTTVAYGFRDYWVAVPGAKGRKADWLATWRNWVRGQKAGRQQSKSSDWTGGAL